MASRGSKTKARTVTARPYSAVRLGLLLPLLFLALTALSPRHAAAAPYADLVMDARTGEILHSTNADARLHPASLTKMMTLYIAFQAVEHGEISMDTVVRISRNAAAEPPSKLGLVEGQRIKLRYLVRAAAVKSANDAATAIGEAIEGSEAAFARRMNRTAQALGMTRTTFKNANGLTEAGHLSTARDMTTLGRHLLFDFPDYYNLFSRKTADAGVKHVNNTNTRLLNAYRGADGIKTGYTRAAGFNLVASAERGNERIIATVFGGRSTASRNAKVAELLDLGFRRAPSNAPTKKPSAPNYASVSAGDMAGKTLRVSGVVRTSLRPQARPVTATAPVMVAMKDVIDEAVAQVTQKAVLEEAPSPDAASPAPVETAARSAVVASLVPEMRPEDLIEDDGLADQEVVTRISTSSGRHWGINIGRYASESRAERVLLQTAISEMSTLEGSLRTVVRKPTGFDANFMGLSREAADLACRRLQARNQSCFMIGPT
ncbi:serine hydrolase [Maritimibacter alkaliphilus]|nr:serine hydrolase [Maritimibacter alkaliphilus]